MKKGEPKPWLVKLCAQMQKQGIAPEAIRAAAHEDNTARNNPPLARADVDGIVDSVRACQDLDLRAITSAPNGNKGGRPQLNYKALADKYLASIAGKYAIRWQSGDWFEFRPGEGWRTIAESNLSARIMTWLQDGEGKKARANTVREILANLIGMKLSGISEDMHRPCWIERDADGMPKATPAQNQVSFDGEVVDVMQAAKDCDSDKLHNVTRRRLSKDFWSTDILSFKLADSYEDRMPLFGKLLDDALDLPEQVALQRMFGVCLSDETRWEVFWILQGAAASGKSTFLRVMECLVGPHNVSRVELQTLIERFQAWPITRQKINITGDMPRLGKGGLGKVEGFFKNVTGQGAKIDVEMKNQQQLLNVPVRARFVFASNTLPYLEDKSEGIWRRLRIIPFERTCPPEKRDPTLADRIIADEMPAIAAWAIEGLSDVLQLKGVPDCERGEAMKAQHRATCDTVRLWIQESGYTSGKDGDRIPAKQLYEEHSEWRHDNGHRPMGAHEFYNRVCEHLRVAKKLAVIAGARVQAFVGIKKGEVTEVTGSLFAL